MEISGTFTFDASPDVVWRVLMDTEAIAACVPGCKALRPLGDNRYEAELVAGVAAVSGEFKAEIALRDLEPPSRYTLVVDAAGRPGFVKGRAVISLAAAGAQTTVSVAATADAGGAIARFGQRLMEGVARMSMDRFFNCIGKRIEGIAKTQ